MSHLIKVKIAMQSRSLQASIVHYTVDVTLQYRFPPLEFSHSHSFTVSGGFMLFVWQDAQKLHVNTAVPWAYLGIHASYTSYNVRKNQLVTANINKKKNTRFGNYLHYYFQPVGDNCFFTTLFYVYVAHKPEGNNKHIFQTQHKP